MEKVGCPHVTETPRRKSCLANLYGMELAFNILPPEIEKPAQFGKIRSQVELLPDEALQQVRVIGEMVDDLRGRQPIMTKFWDGIGHIGYSSNSLSLTGSMTLRTPPCNKKANYNNILAAYKQECCQPRERAPLKL